MIGIVLLAGCLLAGLVIARAANTVTGENDVTGENESLNWAVFLLFMAVTVLGGGLVFAG
jgi:hypothetical protein